MSFDGNVRKWISARSRRDLGSIAALCASLPQLAVLARCFDQLAEGGPTAFEALRLLQALLRARGAQVSVFHDADDRISSPLTVN